jgi:NADH-quinone oxidoreductase subunit C
VTGDEARTLIRERFELDVAPADGGSSELTVAVPVSAWASFAAFARDTLGCWYLSFLTAVDWKTEGLEVVVRTDNLEDGLAVTMRTRLGPDAVDCPSLVAVFRGAEWMERECYDMFGIRFQGHPDLRRILLAEDWDGHPLLKSYAVDTPHPPYR